MLQMFFDVGNIKQSEISRVEIGSIRSPTVCIKIPQFWHRICLLQSCTLEESRDSGKYRCKKLKNSSPQSWLFSASSKLSLWLRAKVVFWAFTADYGNEQILLPWSPDVPPLLTPPQITQLLFYERTFNPGPDVTKPGSWRLLTQNTSLLLTDTKQYVWCVGWWMYNPFSRFEKVSNVFVQFLYLQIFQHTYYWVLSCLYVTA